MPLKIRRIIAGKYELENGVLISKADLIAYNKDHDGKRKETKQKIEEARDGKEKKERKKRKR